MMILVWFCELFHGAHRVGGVHENTTTGSMNSWWYCKKCGLEHWGGKTGPAGSIWIKLPDAP